MNSGMFRPVWLGAALLALAPATFDDRQAVAVEFRIETQVFMAGQKAPASENLTLFSNGVVYDYIVDPHEVTVFDPQRKRFMLLDLDRKLRTEIPTQDVSNNIQELRQKMAAQAGNVLFQWFQNPQFETAIDPETRELVLDSPYLTYRIASIEPKDELALKTYILFANWYARLNAVTKPGSTPPFPRIVVNDALMNRGMIPTAIEFTAKNPSKLAANKSITLNSTHDVQWKLFAEDRRKIDETGKQLVTFKKVSPQEYLQLTGGAPAGEQARAPGGPARK